MSVAFWNARKKQKKNPRLEFQLKDVDTLKFKLRYITDIECFANYTRVARANYEVKFDNLLPLLTLCKQKGFEVVPIPETVEKALALNKTYPFDEKFTETDIYQKLFPFQKEGVRDVISKFQGRALIGDEMGLGKTLQAIAVVQYYQFKRVLIICPAYLRYNWGKEIKKWLGEVDTFLINKGTDEIPDKDGFLVASYELATKKVDVLKKMNYEIAICDESHYLKGHKTKRTKGLTPMLKKVPKVLLLSGTPALNRPCELYPQAHILQPKFFQTWKKFTTRYCNGQMSPLGFYDFSGHSNEAELTYMARKLFMIRRVKRDVLTDLPPKCRSEFYLPTAANKTRKLKPLFSEWQTINKEIKTMVPCSNEIKKASFRRKVLIGELFRFTAEAKLSMVQKVVKDLAAEGQKFIIFCYHMHFMDGLCDVLSDIPYIRIDGSTKQETRDQMVEDFQNNKAQVAVLSILAASTGLTLTACSTVLFGELYFVPGTVLQAEDRIHRIGQKNTCDIRFLIAKDTLDDHVFKLLSYKLETLDNILDARHDRSLAGEKIELEGFEDYVE